MIIDHERKNRERARATGQRIRMEQVAGVEEDTHVPGMDNKIIGNNDLKIIEGEGMMEQGKTDDD